MKIPGTLPQFTNETALFIVTGGQTAHFYAAGRGEIKKIGLFKIPNPRYTDREGFFATRRGGRTFGSGSVYERPRQAIKKKFLKVLAKAVRNTRVGAVYLFAPQRMTKNVRAALPKRLSRKIRMSISGNYTNHGPIGLLKKIQRKKAAARGRMIVTKKEAKKILLKSNKARRVIKTR